MARIDYKAIAEAADIDAVFAAMGIEIVNGKALCPFHSDERPSMQVYRDGYHCFACGAHGDVIDLVQHVKGCSRKEAAQAVAYITGGAIIHRSAASQQRESEQAFRRRQYDADIDRLNELDENIAKTREACYNVKPYTDAWCYAQRQLDKLMLEREIVDNRVLKEMQRRIDEKHGQKRRGNSDHSGAAVL